MKLKGGLAKLFTSPLRLGAMLVIANILIYFISWQSGLLLTVFILVYFAVALMLYMNSRTMLLNEMVSFATEYGQVQRELLKQLNIPYAILDETGHFIWMNEAFEKLSNRQKSYHRSISTVFPDVTRDELPSEEKQEVRLSLKLEDKSFAAQLRRIPMQSLSGDSEMIEAQEGEGALISLCLYDETARELALAEVDNQSLVVGLIYIDNYDEALEDIEDVRRSLLVALIDQKVTKYIASRDGICSKMEKDKYLIILRKSAFKKLEEAHFDLLSDVKKVSIGNEMAITVSIGIGLGGLTYAQNYEFAKNAIDLALGRGGDQAVVKTSENTTYYGGKTQSVEKSTRVKARVKAQAMREILSTRDAVYIMGHRLGDIDSFGACIGIYRIAKSMQKEAHIVLNETTTSLKPIVALFKDNPEYESDMMITSAQAIEKVVDNSVLVIVDVNRPSITECPELLHMCSAIIVLDHHRQGTEKIENATLSYIEGYASSTCEMVSEILQYIGENVKIRQEEADAIYAGIVIDTNNFMNKTGVRTFEAAAFLRRNGADVTRVRKLFREEAVEYKARADAVSQAEIYRGTYAISVCSSDGIESPTVVGAQAANELLNIKGIRGSFVLTQYQDQVFVSARSIDEINVQLIMERLGGGGHMNIAGCQLEDVTVEEAIERLKSTIDAMTEEGEL
ncbi:MAG: DHH family phosphoesterase [Lachnospiraceae bacterium]|nr:DHH family phosphoesterase [Lachnospiraceae bacterium]